MKDYQRMAGLVLAIEDRGIIVRSAVLNGDNFNIDVAEEDEATAAEACQEYWMKCQAEHLGISETVKG